MKFTWGLAASKIVFGLIILSVASIVGAQSFSLSVTPNVLTIHPGDKNIPVTVSVGSSTYGGPISVTLTGLPSGIDVSPLTITAGTSGTLYLSASVSADQEGLPPLYPPSPNSHVNSVMVVAVAGSTETTASMTLTVSLSNPSYSPSPGEINLPIVTINTDGQAIDSKTTDVPGTITITSADGQTSYLPNASDSDNSAVFHVHGNTTAAMPKLPYEFKLNTSLDLLNAMGLSCPYVTSSGKKTCDKSKTYVLLANYDDKTFLRDWAASALANAIPIGNGYLNSRADSPTPSGTSTLMPWAAHSLFVELYLNGAYEGNYQLIEKVNVDSHRVNISELAETDITDDITGGYLLEIDQHEDEAFVFFTSHLGEPIGLIDPDFTPDPEVPQQTSYISNYVDTAENTLYGSNFTDPTQGWRAYFDEASVVNFYIVNDVMGNVDGGDFYSSDYLYKAKDNPLLYMGPIWDFDISSGNVNYAPIENPTVPFMQQRAWYARWFQDPGFTADVVTQWNALKNNRVFTTWLGAINQEASTLQQSQANNFGRWPMQGIEVWPNPEASGSYNGEVSYLTNWISLRIAYLDSVFNNKAQTSTALTVSGGALRQGSPATLSAVVTGGTAPTGNVSFLSGSVIIGVSALDESGSATLTTNNLPAGVDNLEAVYEGDGKNGLSASTPVTVTVLAALVSTATSLSSSVTEVNPQTPTSLTAVVLGNSGTTTPTGIITFTANGQSIGTAPLSNTGIATFAPTLLAAGSNSIQATYGGDNTYQGSASNTETLAVAAVAVPVFSPAAGTYTTAQKVTITDGTPGVTIYYTTDGTMPSTSSTMYSAPIPISSTETLNAIAVVTNYTPSAITTATYTITPSYALVANPTKLSIQQGQGATAALMLTPTGDYSGTVTFNCSSLPANTICKFSQNPAHLTGNNQPVQVGLTIQTNVDAQQAKNSGPEKSGQNPLGAILLALAFWWPGTLVGMAVFGRKCKLLRKRRQWLPLCILLVASAAMSAGLLGCQGSSPVTPAGTFNITVTASSNSAAGTSAETAIITLTVAQ